MPMLTSNSPTGNLKDAAHCVRSHRSLRRPLNSSSLESANRGEASGKCFKVAPGWCLSRRKSFSGEVVVALRVVGVSLEVLSLDEGFEAELDLGGRDGVLDRLEELGSEVVVT